MAPFGVLECFFGPPWSWTDRFSLGEFLASAGVNFYIYGPKAEAHLRKKWQQELPYDFILRLKTLRETFQRHGLQFGIALSPLGLSENMTSALKQVLVDRVKKLNELELDYFGLFFDDMKGNPHLAEQQIELVELTRPHIAGKLVFCPSYYSADPVLDRVFGARPAKYLEKLGAGLAKEVEIVWTGEKVISPEIPTKHLQAMKKTLQRKPFLWDNLYANDGPKNCNFLRVQSPEGRSLSAFNHVSAWALNPMNQIHLSMIVIQAFANFAQKKMKPSVALQSSIHTLCGENLASLLMQQSAAFSQKGLKLISDQEKVKIKFALQDHSGPFESDLSSEIGPEIASEIVRWLDGDFSVGSECLTD